MPLFGKHGAHRLDCGCTFDSQGRPVMLCHEAMTMRHNLHDGIRDWSGQFAQDRRICQLCDEYFTHLGGET